MLHTVHHWSLADTNKAFKEWETAVGKVVGETTNKDKILQKFKQQWPAFKETAHEIISSMQDDDGTGGGGSGGVGSAIVNTRSKKYLIINWTLIIEFNLDL